MPAVYDTAGTPMRNDAARAAPSRASAMARESSQAADLTGLAATITWLAPACYYAKRARYIVGTNGDCGLRAGA